MRRGLVIVEEAATGRGRSSTPLQPDFPQPRKAATHVHHPDDHGDPGETGDPPDEVGGDAALADEPPSWRLSPASPTSRTSSGSPMREPARSAASRVAGVGRCASQSTPRAATKVIWNPSAGAVVAAGSESPGGQAVLPLLDYVSTTTVYLQGIDVEEIIGTIHARRAPMMHVSAGLEL